MTTTMTLDQLVELYDGPDADVLYDEVVTEREHALQAAALAIREWDDEAKMKGAPVPTFDVWVPMLRDLAVSRPARSR